MTRQKIRPRVWEKGGFSRQGETQETRRKIRPCVCVPVSCANDFMLRGEGGCDKMIARKKGRAASEDKKARRRRTARAESVQRLRARYARE